MRLHRRTTARWPFWLLIVGWFCANIPATAPMQVFTWIKGAEHFSHYSTLRESVASMLAGQPRVAAPQLAFSATDSPPHSLPPALPAEVEIRKIDFDPSAESLRLIGSLPAGVRPVWTVHAPAEPVIDVPHPPPRIRGLA